MPDEPVLDPDLPICDAHHHLWEARRLGALSGLNAPDYLLADLLADIGSGHHRVVQTVFVECSASYRDGGPDHLRPVGETEWVANLVAGSDLVGGIVAHADLSLGDAVDDVLDAHDEAANGLLRGIRHATAWDPYEGVPDAHGRPPAGLLGDGGFGAGIDRLGARGLTFDAWVYFHQLPEVVALARAHPDVTVVLDHLGGPLAIGPYADRGDEVLAAWEAGLVELATCDNVVVKLGGIGMPLFGPVRRRPEPGSAGASSDELAAAWKGRLLRVIELFGVDRCMFESNFPVDALGTSYRALWNAFKIVTADLSADERSALFHDTAVRTYRLEQGQNSRQ